MALNSASHPVLLTHLSTMTEIYLGFSQSSDRYSINKSANSKSSMKSSVSIFFHNLEAAKKDCGCFLNADYIFRSGRIFIMKFDCMGL